MKNNRKTGYFFEYIAEKFLVKQGNSIIYKNYYCKYGEIDIVCMQKGITYFVEVKSISRETLEKRSISGAQHVTEQKLFMIDRVSQEFIAKFDIRSKDSFISVVEIVGSPLDFYINYFESVT